MSSPEEETIGNLFVYNSTHTVLYAGYKVQEAIHVLRELTT